MKDFLGLAFQTTPVETLDKLKACMINIHTVQWQTLMIGMIALSILIFWPKRLAKIPPSLIAIIIYLRFILNVIINEITIHRSKSTFGDYK